MRSLLIIVLVIAALGGSCMMLYLMGRSIAWRPDAQVSHQQPASIIAGQPFRGEIVIFATDRRQAISNVRVHWQCGGQWGETALTLDKRAVREDRFSFTIPTTDCGREHRQLDYYFTFDHGDHQHSAYLDDNAKRPYRVTLVGE